jgi:hypothetical protein
MGIQCPHSHIAKTQAMGIQCRHSHMGSISMRLVIRKIMHHPLLALMAMAKPPLQDQDHHLKGQDRRRHLLPHKESILLCTLCSKRLIKMVRRVGCKLA